MKYAIGTEQVLPFISFTSNHSEYQFSVEEAIFNTSSFYTGSELSHERDIATGYLNENHGCELLTFLRSEAADNGLEWHLSCAYSDAWESEASKAVKKAVEAMSHFSGWLDGQGNPCEYYEAKQVEFAYTIGEMESVYNAAAIAEIKADAKTYGDTYRTRLIACFHEDGYLFTPLHHDNVYGYNGLYVDDEEFLSSFSGLLAEYGIPEYENWKKKNSVGVCQLYQIFSGCSATPAV